MRRRVGKMTFEVQHRAERVLYLRISRTFFDKFLEDFLRRFKLFLSYVGRAQCVQIRRITGTQRGSFGQRSLGIIEQVHLQTDSPEPEKNIRIFWLYLLRSHPV